VQFNVGSLEAPTRLARRIVVAAGEPIAVAGKKTTLELDIGIAVAPTDGTAADVLIRRAELSLHRANADEQPAVRFFEPNMDAHVEKRARLERDLRVAIAVSAVAPHYQPIVDLADGRVIGFEGLARWKHPQLGWVPPTSFIAIAEECGLIRELGDQLLRRACRDATSWPTDLKLTFNISPYQLRDRALGMRILSILAETKLDPRRIEIEISELTGDIATAREVISELRRAGVCVALDDFGIGYATVSQLLTLRFDKIKIARSIVQGLGKDANSAVIIKALTGLATALVLSVAAKGIEKPQQLAQLKSAGCLEGQGFLFGQAIAPTEIPALLRRGPRVGIGFDRPTARAAVAK
jgi:predicted signal transduction protein with EAL and GGDEF domain